MYTAVTLAVGLVTVSALGGKPFNVVRPNLEGKNYAVIAVCDDDYLVKAHPINVTLSLKSGPTDEVVINFHSAKDPFEIADVVHSNITEVVLKADASDFPYLVRKVTARIGDTLYKLHINSECDDDPEFLTSRDSVTYWSRRIDCERKDVYCDDRHDEFIGCENVFVYHLQWRKGASGRFQN